MRRVASARVVGLFLAVTAFGVCAFCANVSAKYHRLFDIRPMETEIDLSQPGETTAPFGYTRNNSPDVWLYFECDGLGDNAGRDPKEVFKDLSATFAIETSYGYRIRSIDINDDTVESWDGKFVLGRFFLHRDGDYVAKISVDHGVQTLAGKRQTIYAKYRVCGLAVVPFVLARALGFGAGAIGLVSLLCVAPGLMRYGIWRASPKKTS